MPAHWIFMVLSVASQVEVSQSQLTGCSKDVIIVLDGSSGVGESNFQHAKDTVEVFINESFSSTTNVKIGFAIFGASTKDFKFPDSKSDMTNVLESLRKVIFPNSRRSTKGGLYTASVVIESTANQPKALLLVTVGPADNGPSAIRAANTARASAIDVYAIGVLSELQGNSSQIEVFQQELQQIAPSKVTVIQDFSTFTDAVRGVFNRLCQGCPAYTHYDNSTGRSFTIKKVMVGETVITDGICHVDKRPYGNIECLDNKPYGGIWGKIKLNSHCDLNDLPESGITNSLKKLNMKVERESDAEEVLQTVVNITVNATLTELDVLLVMDILEETNAVNVTNAQGVESVLNIYNNLLRTSDAALLEAQNRGNVGNRLFQGFRQTDKENAGEGPTRVLFFIVHEVVPFEENRMLEIVDTITGKLTPKPSGHNRLATESLLIEVWDLKRPNLPNGLQLNHTMPVNGGTEKTQASITFPNGMLHKLATWLNGSSLHLAMTGYKDTRLFDISQNSTLTNYTLNSKVIAAKIVVDGEAVTDLTGINVTTTFLPNKKQPLKDRRNLTICVYWNFTANDYKGSWSTDGCHYMGVQDGLDVCMCDHLTIFAILMDFGSVIQTDPVHTLALSVITITGLSFSVLGLSLTVLAIIMFRKLRQTDQQRTLLNLALAELCAWIVFLAGFSQTQSHIGCIVAAALLHYFILASFMWMLAEAVLHYRLFVKVMGLYTYRYMLKTGIPAWGIPFLSVIAVVSTDVNLYRRDKYCWLSLSAFFYAFALPVGLIILCNIVIYILIVINICKKSIGTQSKEAKRDRAQAQIKVSFLLFILFGLSWTFGFMAVSDARVVFQYIFCITSSTQGFLIFLFFIAMNSQLRDKATALCCGNRPREDFIQRQALHGAQKNIRSTEDQDCGSQTKQRTQLTTSSLEMQACTSREKEK